MEKKVRSVALLGSIAIDRIMNFGGSYSDLIQPDKIHVLSLSILIDSLKHSRGGVAANIAYTLSLLGDTSSLVASIGSDGTEYLNDLTKNGIDTSHVHISKLPTSTFTVLTDKDDNQVGGFYPGAMSDSDILTLESFSPDTIVVVSAYDPTIMKRMVREAKERGMTLMYDIGQQVSNVPEEDLKEGIKNADILILNDYELGVLSKRTGISEENICKTVPVVITTLGANGSRIRDNRAYTKELVPPVTSITLVDPTGAGDAYRAGFLYGFRREWDLISCCRLGSVMASFAIEKQGTQEHSCTIEEVKNRYMHTYGEQLAI